MPLAHFQPLVSRPGHYSRYWIGNLAEFTKSGRTIKLVEKKSEAAELVFKPFSLRKWMIVHSDALEGVGKVVEFLFEAAKKSKALLKQPGIKTVAMEQVGDPDAWLNAIPDKPGSHELVGTCFRNHNRARNLHNSSDFCRSCSVFRGNLKIRSAEHGTLMPIPDWSIDFKMISKMLFVCV